MRAARARAEAARWLMRRREWDLFFVVRRDPSGCSLLLVALGCRMAAGPPAREIYREIDRGIGALVEEAGPDASVLVVSGDAVPTVPTGTCCRIS